MRAESKDLQGSLGISIFYLLSVVPLLASYLPYFWLFILLVKLWPLCIFTDINTFSRDSNEGSRRRQWHYQNSEYE